MKIICYFYFLYIIKTSFCYECITNGKAVRRLESGNPIANTKLVKQKDQHRRTRRQEFEEEKDPVASIDIASFIQQPDPDYESVDDPGDYNNKRQEPKYEDDLSSLNDLQMYLENNAEENQMNEIEDSNTQVDESLSQRETGNLLDITSFDNKKENSAKISRRRQALPFFSRDEKEKKHKKRKLFNFHFRSKSTTTLLPKYEGPKPNMSNHFNKIVKRSNANRVCPLCKRRIMPKISKLKGKTHSRNIHNSRQYYQTMEDANLKKEKKAVSNNDFLKTNNMQTNQRPWTSMNDKKGREKRDYEETLENKDFKLKKRGNFHEDVKERQLKELEEVQKKVDNLEVPAINVYSNQKTDKYLVR